MQQHVCTTYDVWIPPYFRELQCTLYLNEVGICIVPKHTSSFNKIGIHKNLLIECKKEIMSFGNQKRKACLKLNYFKINEVNGHWLKQIFQINGSKIKFKVLEEASLGIFLSSDQEAPQCIKAIELFLQNARQTNAKPYLVFANPRSGSKNALNSFNFDVVPIWKKMNISYELFCTEYAGHAENTVTNLSKTDLLRYRAIVACSGDGLVNEIINGLLSRSDYAHISAEHTLIIGILPAGSANSTAASICYHSGLFGNSSLLLHCAFLLTLPNENIPVNPCDWSDGHNEHCKFTLPVLPCISPLNGIHFGTCDANFHRFGIQSIEWGLFADVDYKSERFRWMGEKRFLLYMIYYIIKKPKYRAKLSYLPLDNLLRQKMNCTNDELFQASSVLKISSMECGKLDDLDTNVNESQEPVNKSCKSWSFLPDTNQPISNSQYKWVTVDKEFISILALNHSHITSGSVLYPDAHVSDPYLTLLILHGNITRFDLLLLLHAMSNNKSLQSTSCIDVVKICALRVEPYSKESVITMLDGELMPSGIFQAEVTPGILNIISGTKVG
ncbi:hypothetical protein MN116_001809 [Schistosoma mekongi]|uniref:DAGKc domain-containing protein n=1 Tax=Schistosoma mekongi TaxID=38744 RepID=A0AAE1ZJI9_SCHME|nr:hypothetical protein MN116_001809 [Schistosoma mekongi]